VKTVAWELALRLVGDLLVCFTSLLLSAAVGYLCYLARKTGSQLKTVSDSLPELLKDIKEINGFEKGLPNVAASMVRSSELLRVSVDKLSRYFITDTTRAPAGSTFQPSDEIGTSPRAAATAAEQEVEAQLARANSNLIGEV
jgi:hypothetical protein